MRVYSSLVFIATLSLTVATQFLGNLNLISPPFQTFSAPLGGIVSAPVQEELSHPVVVANSMAESQLPQELLNPFYRNPAIASALARESWFGHGEFPVRNREAEKIPRSEIYKLVSKLQSVR